MKLLERVVGAVRGKPVEDVEDATSWYLWVGTDYNAKDRASEFAEAVTLPTGWLGDDVEWSVFPKGDLLTGQPGTDLYRVDVMGLSKPKWSDGARKDASQVRVVERVEGWNDETARLLWADVLHAAISWYSFEVKGGHEVWRPVKERLDDLRAGTLSMKEHDALISSCHDADSVAQDSRRRTPEKSQRAATSYSLAISEGWCRYTWSHYAIAGLHELREAFANRSRWHDYKDERKEAYDGFTHIWMDHLWEFVDGRHLKGIYHREKNPEGIVGAAGMAYWMENL